MQPLACEYSSKKVIASIVDWVSCCYPQRGDCLPTKMESGRVLQFTRTSLHNAVRDLLASHSPEQTTGDRH
jgi:hypothetical protein